MAIDKTVQADGGFCIAVLCIICVKVRRAHKIGRLRVNLGKRGLIWSIYEAYTVVQIGLQ